MRRDEGEGTQGGDFRPELEGLRGVAVALVVLYHAGLLGVRGGFVGVDVFYVLSGFFITALLLREHAATGRVSLAAFYARRMRRLLPAADLTILATVVASWLILPPLRFPDVGRDAAAAALYVSNIRFAQFATDYLHAGGAPSPFLHFWSLGVEEQFYALWPLVLIALLFVGGGRRAIAAVAGGLVAASFACSIWLTSYSQPWAFFNLPARAWELGLGALLAVAPARAWRSHPLQQLLGWSGLGLVVAAGFVLSADTAFPGYAAAMPAVGGALVIAGGMPSRFGVARILAARPLRAIGRWSYSLYLWHWPLITLAAAALGHAPSTGVRIAVVAAAVAVSAASYRLVETPPRRSRRLGRRARYGLVVGLAASAAAAAAGAALVVVPGPLGVGLAPPPTLSGFESEAAAAVVPSNLRPALRSAQGDLPPVYSDGCHLSYTATASPPCLFGDVNGPRTLVLLGDSHAAQWFPALASIASRLHWRLESLTKSACPATFAAVPNPAGAGTYRACVAWHENVLRRLAHEHPYLVVVSSLVPLPPSSDDDHAWLVGEGEMIRALRRVADHVVALGDVPRPRANVPICLSAHIRSVAACATPRSAAVDAGLWAAARQEATENGAGYIGTDRWACPGAICPVIAGDLLLYRDNTHLTVEFVHFLEPRLERALLEEIGCRRGLTTACARARPDTTEASPRRSGGRAGTRAAGRHRGRTTARARPARRP